MEQRLLVEFSCDPHIDILLRDLWLVLLLVFVTSGCYNSLYIEPTVLSIKKVLSYF